MRTSKKLANTVGERINEYDTFITQNVGNFNAMFPECPLKGFDVEDPVAIDEVAPNNCRVIFVDGEPIIHKMYSDVLYNVDREVSRWLDHEEVDDLAEIQGHIIYE